MSLHVANNVDNIAYSDDPVFVPLQFPFTVSVWSYIVSFSGVFYDAAWSAGVGNTASLYIGLYNPNSTFDAVEQHSLLGRRQASTYPNANITNTWVHWAGYFQSKTYRQAIFNGNYAAISTGSNVGTVDSVNAVWGARSVGNNPIGPPTYILQDAYLSHGAIWSTELDEWEIKALSKGVAPSDIRPDSLISYLPFEGNLNDYKGLTWQGGYAPAGGATPIFSSAITYTAKRLSSVSLPIGNSDLYDIDTAIKDYRATRLSTYAYLSTASEIEWGILSITNGTEYYIKTYPDKTSNSSTVLNVDFTDQKAIVDIWFPPYEEFMFKTRMKIGGSWTRWTVWSTGTALGYINSYEKYQILNRQTQTIY